MMMDEGPLHIWLSVHFSHPHPHPANSDSLFIHLILLKGLKQQHFRSRVKGVQKPPGEASAGCMG